MAAVRRVDALNVSPDGRHAAIFVRQGDPALNAHVGGWFVVDTTNGMLRHVGTGGELLPGVGLTGGPDGSIERRTCRWSPDGRWLAYTVRRKGELQLWRSKAEGTVRYQVTHSDADIREFAWRSDGRALYFSVGLPRQVLRMHDEAKRRAGYHYDDDLYSFTDFMLPQLPLPPDSAGSTSWVVSVANGRQQPATALERSAFDRARLRDLSGLEQRDGPGQDAVVPPVARPDGALLRLTRASPHSSELEVAVSTSAAANAEPIRCSAPECSGAIQGVWWSDASDRVLIWRREGIAGFATGFYEWAPDSGAVRTLVRSADDYFQHCDKIQSDRLLCVRQTPARPSHLVAISARSGQLQVLADLNPEFQNIRLGAVERIEWDTPEYPWTEPGGRLSGVYPRRTFGYVLYPPNFTPDRKYPVVIEPYSAANFDNETNFEHPLHVYAAHGFIVLHAQFPLPIDVVTRLGPSYMKQLYSEELGYPHLTMLTDSSLRGLDRLAARGVVDESRVGIGGTSHGTFVPLFMLQKYDRIAAISISGATRGQFEYYVFTRKGREAPIAASKNVGYEDWLVKPEGTGREFWRGIDIADHVDAIEAPILMNLPANETFGVVHLLRHLADANKPYDAYVYPAETHIKWQPAHLKAIMIRNVDWFRFWLQGYEDPAPEKAEQYERWRAMRVKQCELFKGSDAPWYC